MSIVRHARVDELQEEIRELRQSLLRAQEEWYATSVVLREQLTSAYHAAFGDVEAEIQRLALNHAEILRRVELLTVKHDRGEQITAEIVAHVNHIVDREYQRFRERMAGSRASAADASNEASDRIRDDELVRMFRVVAKRLHPDVNGKSSDASLWHRARLAYEHGDLRTLQSIEAGTSGDELVAEIHDLATLTIIAERLAGRLVAEQKKLARLRMEEPFTLEHVLHDEQWRQLHRATLERQRDAWAHAVEQTQLRYRELTSGVAGAQTPDATKAAAAASGDSDFMESTYFGFR
jgi:hypothetical protein